MALGEDSHAWASLQAWSGPGRGKCEFLPGQYVLLLDKLCLLLSEVRAGQVVEGSCSLLLGILPGQECSWRGLPGILPSQLGVGERTDNENGSFQPTSPASSQVLPSLG